MTSSPLSRCCCCRATRVGTSARQGPHQVPQSVSSTTFPFLSEILNLVPSINSKSASATPDASGGNTDASVDGEGLAFIGPLATPLTAVFCCIPEQPI